MGEHTAIEWTDATWNPWMGCTKVSPACQNCYAERDMKRYGRDFSKITRTSNKTFNSPLTWKDPKKVFVCSWSDFFHKDVPRDWREEAMAIMEKCDHHTFLLLTKRPENIVPFTKHRWRDWPANVWIGTTVENQEMADKRIPELLRVVGAEVRFVSMEPLCDAVDLENVAVPVEEDQLRRGCFDGSKFNALNKYDEDHFHNPPSSLNWVIVGGESGPYARPLHPQWVRILRDQCACHSIPFLFKQWGEYIAHPVSDATWPNGQLVKPFLDPVKFERVGRKNAGCELDGKTHKESPDGKERVL